MAVVIFAERTGRRVVSATISVVEAPHRQYEYTPALQHIREFGRRSARARDVGRPQASQLGFGVFLRMGDRGENAASPVSFRRN